MQSQVKGLEASLSRTERALRTISQCQQVLVRATREAALLEEVCRVIVDPGGYRMAWVGFAENDKAKTVRVGARAGHEEGYLSLAKIVWDEGSGRGRGPVGTAIRSGEMTVSHDLANDASMAPWRTEAVKRGYAALIVMPLQSGGKNFGVLSIYAGETNAFNATEVELLKQLADDLAYGIQALRTRVENERAEAAIRRSEQNYREIFNATNDAIFLHDAATGELLDVNEAMLRLYGCASKAEALSKNAGDLSANEPPYTETEAYQHLRRAITDGPQVFEWRSRKQNGELFWTEVSLRSSHIGGAGRVLAVVRDITERKRTEEEIRAILSATMEGFYLLDPDGRFLETNDAYCRMSGYSREELLKMAVKDVEAIETEEEIKERRRVILEAGHVRFETKHKRKDGRIIDIEASCNALRDEKQRIVAFMRDITERKQAEEQMREMTERLVEAQQIARLGSYHFDTKTRQWTSSRVLDELFGIADTGFRRDMAGWLGIVHPEDREVMQRYLVEEVLEGRKVFDRAYRIIRQNDKSERWVHGLGKLIVDERGQVVEMVGVIQDITERQQLENRLQQVQKMQAIGRLAGGVAHDFNNILAAMFGYAYLLQQDTAGNTAAQESVAELLKAAERAKDLVQQILTFSRQREQKLQVIKLESIVKEAMKFLRASLPAQIKFEMELSAEAPAVRADPTQVYQVIINLATNALQAMEGRPGRLRVSLGPFLPDEQFMQEHPEAKLIQHARLAIADTGHGMDAKTLERIFEPFFTTKPAGKGTGLGLAVVHGIVESYEGIVTVESRLGEGTTFRLYFPGQVMGAAPKEGARREYPSGRGQKVMLVDDEPGLTVPLQQLLMRLDYNVSTFNEAREAVRVFQEDPAQFDLVITDLTMPEMNGLELASQIHAIRPGLPIILTSGYVPNIPLESMRAAGIRELIDKPVRMNTLAEVMRRVLERGA